MKITILFILSFLFAAAPTHLSAQSDIDHNRMDRDLRIMENVLTELFQIGSEDEQVHIRIANTTINRHLRGSEVQGSYYEDYGIVFSISNQPSHRWVVRSENNGELLTFRYGAGDDTDSKTINEENVRARIVEFFTEYAPTIGQLEDSDRVMVVVGKPSQNRSRTTGVFIHASRQTTENLLPEMVIWTDSESLRRYRSGDLSDEQFEQHLRTEELKDSSELRDFNIFASVLKASFEHQDLENLSIRQDPAFTYLPGLGVHFLMDVSTRGQRQRMRSGVFGHGDTLDFSSLGEPIGVAMKPLIARLDSVLISGQLEFNVDSLATFFRGDTLGVRGNRDFRIHLRDHDLRRQASRQNPMLRFRAEDYDEETIEKIKEQVEIAHKELKSAVKDYGSTLRSLPDDELLIMTIHWIGHHPSTPEKSELRIKKSDLLQGVEPVIEIEERK